MARGVLTLAAVALLCGCAAPAPSRPFYIPPPAPLQPYVMQLPKTTTTNCVATAPGRVTCITR